MGTRRLPLGGFGLALWHMGGDYKPASSSDIPIRSRPRRHRVAVAIRAVEPVSQRYRPVEPELGCRHRHLARRSFGPRADLVQPQPMRPQHAHYGIAKVAVRLWLLRLGRRPNGPEERV